jgi:hypothetical protein
MFAGLEETNGVPIETASKLPFVMMGSANAEKGTRRQIAVALRIRVAEFLISPP